MGGRIVRGVEDKHLLLHGSNEEVKLLVVQVLKMRRRG